MSINPVFCPGLGIPAASGGGAVSSPSCVKCGGDLQGWSCDSCDGLGYLLVGWEGYRAQYDDCSRCAGMGTYYDCTECGARWSCEEIEECQPARDLAGEMRAEGARSLR